MRLCKVHYPMHGTLWITRAHKWGELKPQGVCSSTKHQLHIPLVLLPFLFYPLMSDCISISLHMFNRTWKT